MHFLTRILLTKFQNLVLKLHTELATVIGLLKSDKFGSNLFLILKFASFNNLPPKNDGFKAWSRSVRMAKSVQRVVQP